MAPTGPASRRSSGRRSLSVTSAARVSSDEVTPEAISPTLRIEAGAMSIPRVRNEPEDNGAPTSAIAHT